MSTRRFEVFQAPPGCELTMLPTPPELQHFRAVADRVGQLEHDPTVVLVILIVALIVLAVGFRTVPTQMPPAATL